MADTVISPELIKGPSTYGKGSKRRPEDLKAYQRNWEDIFGKKAKVKERSAINKDKKANDK